MTAYTDIIDGFQIRDVTYLGDPQKDAPIQFDIVKWEYHRPREVISLRTGGKVMSDRNCYSVAFLVWNEVEKHFDFKQVNGRWVNEKKTERVIEMISEFTKKKGEELCIK